MHEQLSASTDFQIWHEWYIYFVCRDRVITDGQVKSEKPLCKLGIFF
jgi:hypothetical protein